MMPTIGMMLVTSIYSIVDGFFVSNFTGSTNFAAMNIIWPFLAMLSVTGILFGTGGSAIVSNFFGAQEPEKANRVFSMIVKVCLYLGVVLGTIGFIFMKPITIALGAQGDMIEPAVQYGRIVILSLPAFIIQLSFQSFYMCAELPQLGTKMSIICGVANIVFDAIFVLLFGWGLAGAAIATVIGIFTGGLYPLWYFRSKRNHTQLKLIPVKIEWKFIGKACTNGLSEYVGNIALNVVSVCYNIQLMKFIGENGVSAYGIIMYVAFLFAAIFIGYNLGIAQIISYNHGASNYEEMRSLLKKSLVLSAVIGVILTAISEISAPFLFKAFVGYDPQICELGTKGMRIYMLCFLICGINMFVSAWFTALGKGLVSALVAFSRTMIFELSAILILPSIFGVDGIWVSVNVAEILAFVMAISILTFSVRKM